MVENGAVKSTCSGLEGDSIVSGGDDIAAQVDAPAAVHNDPPAEGHQGVPPDADSHERHCLAAQDVHRPVHCIVQLNSLDCHLCKGQGCTAKYQGLLTRKTRWTVS